MVDIKVKAPAKINLGLHVISKRDDGYHNIETIFYPIELSDILTFKKSRDFTFTSNNEELNRSSDNLVIKAKKILEKETKQEITVQIHLEKNIPIGGGLGGGSSDAAATLTTLNNFLGFKLEKERIKSLAMELGSDVPFFLNPKPSLASSKGEILEPTDLKINYPILIVNPGVPVSTKWAYSNINPKTPAFKLRDIRQDHFDAPNKLIGFLKNDFEEVVFKEYPAIKKLKEDLYDSGALLVLMSGSGSTIWSLFKDVQLAEIVMKRFRTNYFTFLQKN